MNLSESYKKRLTELAGLTLESTVNFDGLLKIAKGVDYDIFLNKTDSLTSHYNMLYRGSADDYLQNDSFMTDYIGHAREYGDIIDGIIYNHNDVLYFNDTTFNNLRNTLNKLNKKNLMKIYLPYFNNGKLLDAMVDEYSNDVDVIKFVFNFLRIEIPFSKVQQNKYKTDLLIPIMMHYAINKNKNIISFLGGDYSDYGGTDEFVVHDVGRYVTLKSIWEKANS